MTIMSNIAIKVEHLSKQYRLGEVGTGTISHDLNRWWHRMRGKEDPYLKIGETNDRTSKGNSEYVWALQDINFEVQQGEVLGIIGKNGAGKSTLLKILSKVTAPTTGAIKAKGRIASLLEVGTGFHPELTGRENIYLNGTILGMTRAEVKAKLDEIVDFAGVERYLDTPVKRYSSGMMVRLGFAVAAHLEPEILIVDEVLAVGDAEFQKKAIGKMQEVSQEGGRTVLFVSHSMNMIQRLCENSALLNNGKIDFIGKSSVVVNKYINKGIDSPARRSWELAFAPGDQVAKLCFIEILNEDYKVTSFHEINKSVYVKVEYMNYSSEMKVTTILHILNEEGLVLFATNDFSNKKWWHTQRQKGLVRAVCKIPENFLAEGKFFVTVALGTYNPNTLHAIEKEAVSFNIVDNTQGEGVRGEYAGGNWPGVIRPMLEWHIEFE